jgi:protein TonB
MAFADRNIPSRQRAIAAFAVAALEGAAIVALVQGLSVAFTPPAPPRPLAAQQWRAAPLPKPQEPVAEPQQKRAALTDNQQEARPYTPPVAGPVFSDLKPFAFDEGDLSGGAGGTVIEPPRPRPSPTGIASSARARNDPGTWVTPNDYPARDLREGNHGTARFRLSIGSDGRVQTCEITVSSGFTGLDAATCTNISRRARFDPATDTSGGKIAGTYSGSIGWLIPR